MWRARPMPLARWRFYPKPCHRSKLGLKIVLVMMLAALVCMYSGVLPSTTRYPGERRGREHERGEVGDTVGFYGEVTASSDTGSSRTRGGSPPSSQGKLIGSSGSMATSRKGSTRWIGVGSAGSKEKDHTVLSRRGTNGTTERESIGSSGGGSKGSIGEGSAGEPMMAPGGSPSRLITLFTTFKAGSRTLIHGLILRNWAALSRNIHLVLFTPSVSGSLLNTALSCNWSIVNATPSNPHGTPFIRPMFLYAYKKYQSYFYAYINSDILLTPMFIKTLQAIQKYKHDHPSYLNPFLVGHRIDYILQNTTRSDLWKPEVVRKELFGKNPSRVDAIDYFITTKYGLPWNKLPNLVIGRRGYDQYLIMAAIRYNMTVISLSRTCKAMHLLLTQHSERPNHRLHTDANYNYNLLLSMYGSVPWNSGNLNAGSHFTKIKNREIVVEPSTNWTIPVKVAVLGNHKNRP